MAPLLRKIWNYTGSIAALSLMLGVLGLSIYHQWLSPDEDLRSRFYAGLHNTAGPEQPKGIDPLAGDDVERGSHMRLDYDEQGRITKVQHVSAQGRLRKLPASRVAEQRIDYDKQGRVIAKRNYDVHGALAPDSAGVAQRGFKYDEQGRLHESNFKGVHGELVMPYMPGYALRRVSYDAASRPLLIEHLDGQGKAVINADGEAQISYDYGKDGSSTRSNKMEGKLVDNALGYAIERRLVSNGGSTKRVEWYDANSEPVVNRDRGCAVLHRQVEGSGKLRRCLYLDEHGQATSLTRVPVEHMERRNERGGLEWECFNAADGLPCIHPKLGYAERACEYGESDVLEREFFRNEQGQPSSCYEKRYALDDGQQHVISLYRDGSTKALILP